MMLSTVMLVKKFKAHVASFSAVGIHPPTQCDVADVLKRLKIFFCRNLPT